MTNINQNTYHSGASTINLKQNTKYIKGFISKWNDKDVSVYLYEVDEHRRFERKPLFDNVKFFRGKNICFETNTGAGWSELKYHESKESKLKQLWNYYIKGQFKMKIDGKT